LFTYYSIWIYLHSTKQRNIKKIQGMCPDKTHSRLGWMRLWATWSSWRCPCSLQRGWAKWPLKNPSNPN